jgi:hypothetical protein
METQEMAKGMLVRDAAIALGLRSQSIYNLLRDCLLKGEKTETGEWLIDRESVERYRLHRSLRRIVARNALQSGAIEIRAEAHA